MAYKKSPLKATRLRKHKRNIRITIGVIIVIILGGIVFGIWKLVRLPIFMISQVNVEIENPGNSVLSMGDIQTVVSTELAGTYWHFFPKANRLWYPQDVIRQDILNNFPSVDFISFSAQGSILSVGVEERQPAYVWCSSASPNSTNLSSPVGQTSDCYFTDATGYIFSPVLASSSLSSYLTLYGPLSISAATSTDATSSPAMPGITPAPNSDAFDTTFSLSVPDPVGQMYTDPTDFKNIVTFGSDLGTLGLKVASIESEGSGVYDAYLVGSGRIIFKSSDDPDVLESDIATLKANNDIFSQNGTSTLDYVDLRFGDKVYYKLGGE